MIDAYCEFLLGFGEVDVFDFVHHTPKHFSLHSANSLSASLQKKAQIPLLV